ncbi:MAG: leucine-rich repeat protein [Clostridia bacterium]|nr:leucine-rich repeat protein [Clostridia bacterium]
MQKTKKALSVLLSILMVLTVIPMAFVPAFAEDDPPASEPVWSYDETTDTLTITGSGAIPAGTIDLNDADEDFILNYVNSYPHPEYMRAKHIVIGEGVTSIGSAAFFFFNAETVSLPSTLESIGDYAFGYCIRLEEINFPASLRSIGMYAFGLCPYLRVIDLNEGLVTLGAGAFMSCFPTEIHIPSTLELGQETNLANYFMTEYLIDLYNNNLTAVMNTELYNFDSPETANRYVLRNALGYEMEMLYYMNYPGDDEPDEAAMLEIYAQLADRINEKLGTDYTVESVEDVEAMVDDIFNGDIEYTYGIPAYFTVYCAENSAQHTACGEMGYRHKVNGSDDFCMNEAVFSGDVNGLTWVIDPDTRTLTFGGSGTLAVAAPAPWKPMASYFDKVDFTADCTVTVIDFAYETNPFTGCVIDLITLPASLRSLGYDAFANMRNNVGAFAVADGNTVYYAEDGALYRYLTNEDRANLAAEDANPGPADLVLMGVPRNAQSITLSSRTAVLANQSVYYTRYLTSLTVPDSVVSIEEYAVSNNNRLTSVALGSGVKLLNANSIDNGYNDTAITVSDANPNIKAGERCILSKDGSRIVMMFNEREIETYTVGEEITSIDPNAFIDAYALKSFYVLNPTIQNLVGCGLRRSCTVYGYEGSTAQSWAAEWGYRFVVIEEKEITGVQITKQPTITLYTVNDTLNLDGLELTVTFADGTTGVRTDGYTDVSYDFTTAGEKTVSLSYAGFTVSFTVTVSDTAPEYEIALGETLPLLLLKSEDYDYDCKAIVKYVCEQTGFHYPALCYDMPMGYKSIEIYDENMEKVASSSTVSDGAFEFVAGNTYYIECKIYNERVDENRAATLTLYAEHDHTADTYQKVYSQPTCTTVGWLVTYCSVCDKFITQETIERTPHTLNANGYCTGCGKLFAFNIASGEVFTASLKEYSGDDRIIGTYVAEETKTVTVTITMNSNYGAPTVRHNGETVCYGVEDYENRTFTFTFAAAAGETYEIVIAPAYENDTMVVAVDHEHDFTQIGYTAPTCYSYGLEVLRCESCGVTFNKRIERTNHTPDGEYEEIYQEPSCITKTNGYRYLRCAVCGETYYDGLYWQHTDDNRDGVCDVCGDPVGAWLALNEPYSFTASGQQYHLFPFIAPADGEYEFVMRCGDVLGGGYSIATKDMGDSYMGGDWVNSGTIRVTLKAGEIRRFCAGCYDLTDYTVVVNDIHQVADGEETPATCTEDGHINGVCLICGQEINETLPATGHKDENFDGLCDNCGERLTETLELNVPYELHATEYESYDFLFTAPADGDYLFSATDDTAYPYGIVVLLDPAAANFSPYTSFIFEQSPKQFSMTAGQTVKVRLSDYVTANAVITVADVHQLTAVPAAAASCTEPGNTAYWTCAICGKCFSDENGENEISADSAVIPAFHSLEAHSANDATCVSDGNIAYWYCTECGKYWSDQALTNEIGYEDTILPGGHVMVEHPGAQATCTENGNLPYYECTRCGKFFIDGDGNEEIVDHSEVILPAHHNLVKVNAKNASCTENGNVEYWKCGVCGDYFADENAQTKIADKNSVILPAHHTLTRTAGKAATCKEAGNIEYWTCSVCGNKYSDANGANPVTDVTLPKLTTHTWNAGVETVPATCTAVGKKTYTCTVCGATKSEDIPKAAHRDNNGDGLCDYGCGTVMGGQTEQPTEPSQPSGGDKCPLCGETHTGFFGKIVGFFHRIAYFFQNLFRR